MKATLLESPSKERLIAVKQAALITVGKNSVKDPSDEWLVKIADAEHSPIRMLQFRWEISAPYWVLNELRTHHVGCEMFMQSSRNDRQPDFDRNNAPQGMERKCVWTANLQGLMDVSHRRLCNCASKEMRVLTEELCRQVVARLPWTRGLFMPMCDYRGGWCHEMKCCGRRPVHEGYTEPTSHG